MTALYLIAERHISAASDQIAARIGNQVARISGLVDDELISIQPKLATKLISTLLSDPAITCVDILSNGKRIVALSQPKNLGCEILKPEKSLNTQAMGMKRIQLRVGFNEKEIRALRSDTMELAAFTVIFGTIAAILLGYFAFRYSVSNPIRKLILAMKRVDTKDQGPIQVKSEDEIGELYQAFNCMQERIVDEIARTKKAHFELSNVYNETPALLFTMDSNGIIKSASDHWLRETGYELSEVVDNSLEAIMCPHSRARLKSSVLCDIKANASVRDVPLCLWNKDGSEIDVLLSIKPDRREDDQQDSFVCVMNNVSLLRKAEKDLHNLAVTDQLTGLPNRRGLNEFFEKLKTDCDHLSDTCAVLFIDLDNFKSVNDSYGHQAGDEILKAAAQRISNTIGDNNLVSRIGGDEFAVVLKTVSDVKNAEAIAEKLIEELCKPVQHGDFSCYVGASIGIAFSHEHPLDFRETLRLSDQAMYVAKSNGKNRYCVYESNKTAEIQTRAEHIQLLQNGIDEDWFDIYLQPIMNMDTMTPYAFEALLRVKRKDIVINSIESLIRVAEETGQMAKLGKWIFEKSVSKFRTIIADMDNSEIALTVNLSPLQLTENFVHSVKQYMLNFPDMEGKLIFEITETAAIDRFDAICILLQDLRDSGIRIALDDFGSGYSSLSYIGRLPIDIIKLDKSLIKSASQGTASGSDTGTSEILIRNLAILATELKLDVVAEGLETVTIKDAYKAVGVKLGQGYLFSKPMSVQDAVEWLAVNSECNHSTAFNEERKISA